MSTSIKGPGIFLAQYLGDDPPYRNLQEMTAWVAELGFKGVQLPGWDARVLDLDRAATSQDYCDEVRGLLHEHGIALIEVAAYLQGQCVAMHPAYERLFQPFYPAGLGDTERLEWATSQLIKTVDASKRLGTHNISVLSGGLAWPFLYPWPQRSEGLVEEAFTELANRWRPVLDYAAQQGVTMGYELHPGSDLFDGTTFLRFLDLTDDHPSACLTYDPSHLLLQQMDYLQFIEIFADRIKAFHVKDAEYNPTGLAGVYGSFSEWIDRPGRFRSLGDGQVDFKRVFTLLIERGFDGWAILEWEDCIKTKEQGAQEAVHFIQQFLGEKTTQSFDDFAKSETDRSLNRQLLGLKPE